MKKGLILLVCLSFLLPNATTNDLILKSGIGSSDFGVAVVGIAAAILMRDSKKK